MKRPEWADGPSRRQVLTARTVVAAHHPRTPLWAAPALSGARQRVYVKCEQTSAIRSFKGRGALARLAALSGSEKAAGVVTASTGNHGQGVAWAGRTFGVAVRVHSPVGTADVKVAAMRRLGADLAMTGSDLAEAADHAAREAAATGRVFIEDGNDPWLMSGAATVAWEILAELPTVDRIVVPVGGANLLAGIVLVARDIAPHVEIIGVQSAAAPAVHHSWKAGRITRAPCRTTAGGLATSFPGRLAFDVVKNNVDDIVLVTEDELDWGVGHVLRTTGQLAERAAVAPFVTHAKHGAAWHGETVLVLTGSNIDPGELRQVLDAPRPDGVPDPAEH
jgi:threonine dehydratase